MASQGWELALKAAAAVRAQSFWFTVCPMAACFIAQRSASGTLDNTELGAIAAVAAALGSLLTRACGYCARYYKHAEAWLQYAARMMTREEYECVRRDLVSKHFRVELPPLLPTGQPAAPPAVPEKKTG